MVTWLTETQLSHQPSMQPPRRRSPWDPAKIQTLSDRFLFTMLSIGFGQVARRTTTKLGGYNNYGVVVWRSSSTSSHVTRNNAASALLANSSPTPLCNFSVMTVGRDNNQQHRSLATTATAAATPTTKKAKKTAGTKKEDDFITTMSYQERKDAAKQKRRETYERTQARLANLPNRRAHSEKDVKKKLFRSWYDGELRYHNHLLRSAKKANMGWRTRVAVMVERIPIVTEDMDNWEKEYIDLRDWLLTYGKEYPEESGFMYAMDKPEDHIVPTDEELLAGLPFTPAPRETEADKTGNIHTLDRQLKTSVFLAIQSTNEGTMSNIPRWTLPSAIATSTDDTLLAVAQRAVTNVAGPNLKIWCPGNAPMAVNLRVYNPKLPAEFRENYYGERIYYYRVQHDSGDVSNDVILSSSSSSESSKAASIAASSKKGKKKKEEEVVVEEKKGHDISDWGWLSKNEIVERVEGERGKHQAKFFHYML